MGDGIGIALFVIFAFNFKYRTVPATMQNYDQLNLTASDFSVELLVCPAVLDDNQFSDDHRAYEKKMKDHFLSVLERLNEEEEDDIEEGAVATVSIVRNYDGAVSQFMDKGQILNEIENHLCLRKRYLKEAKKHSLEGKEL